MSLAQNPTDLEGVLGLLLIFRGLTESTSEFKMLKSLEVKLMGNVGWVWLPAAQCMEYKYKTEFIVRKNRDRKILHKFP
jgi:hypothetical protein